MKKTLGLLLVTAMLILSVSGCSGSGISQSGSQNIKVLLTLCEMDTFRKTLVDSAQSRAAEVGVQLDVLDAENSIENQVAHIKKAVEEGYDAIICSAVSIDTVVELKASAGNIPIIFINSCPDAKYLEEGRYIYVGSDEQVAGQFQAEYVLEQFSGRSELNVVIFKGPKGHSATNGRTKGAKQALSESGMQIHYVFEDNADWDQERARMMLELFLKTGTRIDCVICNNDSMALGVVEACKAAGIDVSATPILGVDATVDGCAAIENGEMAFTVYQSGKGQGSAAIDAAIRIARGESLKDMEGITENGLYIWVPFERVDSSNVANYK